MVILDLLVSIGITQALRLVEHDLIDLLVEFLVVAVIASHGQTPNDQPQTSSQDGHNHVQDVVRVFLLGREYKQLFVHGASLSGDSWVSDKDTNVSVSVSSDGVFTIGVHPPIIPGCNQIRIYERASAKESESYAPVRASVRRLSLIGAASFERTCHELRRALPTPA